MFELVTEQMGTDKGLCLVIALELHESDDESDKLNI